MQYDHQRFQEVEKEIHEEVVIKESFYPYFYPAYHKYFTLEEIRSLIQFYKTPLGRKTSAVMPKLAQEGIKAGQLWGQSIAPKISQRVLNRIQTEGIKIKK